MSASTLALSAVALAAATFTCAGTAIGAAQVNIVDPTVARTARVEAGNRLAVQEVPPVSYFHAAALGLDSTNGCKLLATAPSGKALIVRQVQVNVFENPNPGIANAVILYANADCENSGFIRDVNPQGFGLSTMTFDPGLVVPEGAALSVVASGSVAAEAYLDGYTVAPAVAPIAGQTMQVRGKSRQK